MELILSIAIPLILIGMGYFAGRFAEYSHFSSLEQREHENLGIVRTNSRAFLVPRTDALPPTLVCAETAIASDYFKNFLSAFRKFFGGEMRSYNSLMERARRETILRLVEQARSRGYNAICNLRLEPSDIGSNLSQKGSIMVCMIGSATAYHSEIPVLLPEEISSPQPPIK